ncbi:MAG: catalase [Flavobacteriales bacterium]|nr:catalase [Flavobacteriales bacterium]
MAKRSSDRASNIPNRTPADAKRTDLLKDTTDGTDQVLTSNQGLPINDNQNSLKAGLRGPTLLEDHLLREKITHFDHERIPERAVHARGSGAHGYFQVYKSMSAATKAGFLHDPGRRTPVFVRFSTVAGSRGSADAVRDARGFAVKFYTEEGIYDLVGNNIPVFFIQDAIKFPDLVHAVKPEPHHEMPQAASAHDTFWDFISLMPESMHMIMWVMSDRAIPRSYRMMEGFGVHTFRFVNAKGEGRFVKFHWKPLLGVHSLAWDEATKINGKDPDFHRRDLWEAIESGNFPEWELGVQIVEDKDEHKFPFDLLDPTKLIPEELVPVQRVGKMTLDRNPDNFFAETEQVAFHPAHLVPGIDFSNDPLLQGRLFSYTDTQLSRLGSANFNELPINRPIVPVHNNQRDGHMRHAINAGRVNYEPNTLGGGCPYQAMMKEGGFASFPEPVEGLKVRGKSEKFHDHYSQAALFFRSQSVHEQNHLVNALRFELGKLEVPAVRERMIGQLAYVDADLAERVAEAFGIAVPEVELPLNHSIPADTDPQSVQPYDQPMTLERSAALSMQDTIKGSIKTRRVAMLVTDEGVVEAAELKKVLERNGAVVKIIAPVNRDLGLGKNKLSVDHGLMTTSSVLFDAVAVVGGKNIWMKLPDAKDFVSDAFRHSKAIVCVGDAADLLDVWGLTASEEKTVPGIVTGRGAKSVAPAFINAIAAHRHWLREADPLTGEVG